MSAAPDRVNLDLNERDRHIQEASSFWAAHIGEAKAELKDQLLTLPTSAAEMLHQPSVDTSLDLFFNDLPAALGEDYAAFRAAIADGKDHDLAEVGQLVRKALERAADDFIKCKNGEIWLSNRIYALKRDHNEGYSS